MSADRTRKALSELRDQLRSPLLNAEQQHEAEQAMAKLEAQLHSRAPANLEVLEDLLRQWEADIEVNHPVIAGIVSETLRRLAAMGI